MAFTILIHKIKKRTHITHTELGSDALKLFACGHFNCFGVDNKELLFSVLTFECSSLDFFGLKKMLIKAKFKFPTELFRLSLPSVKYEHVNPHTFFCFSTSKSNVKLIRFSRI